MSSPLVADQIVATLAGVGVKRIYGIVGDSLNGVIDALRRHGGLEWLHVRHEEVGAFAAGAEAHLTGELAVCAGSCGPGNLHLINGLFDCHRSRVPVVAIAAQIPSAELGSSYFQETHPEQMFKECSSYCELISSPDHAQRVLETAIRRSIAESCVSVVVIPGDVALQPALPGPATPKAALALRQPVRQPREAEVAALADLLNGAEKVTLMVGSGVAGAHDEVIQLAEKLQAPIVHALRGKEYIEYDNPFDVGMTGLIGFSSGYYAMENCDALLMLGTDFPYRQFYPTHARIAQVDVRPEAIGRRAPVELGVVGEVAATLQALTPRLKPRAERGHLDAALKAYREARASLDSETKGRAGGPLHPQQIADALSRHASENAVFTADVGLPTVWAARHVAVNGQRRLIGSFWHGSMANALAQAIGAQSAFRDRQVISMSGDGGFAMLMGDFLTLAQHDLPVKLVVFNNGTLGFVELEQKSTGFLNAGVKLKNPNFAAMAEAMGVKSFRIEDPAEVDDKIAAALAHPGPVLIDAVVNRMELAMPPKITAEMAKGFTLYMVKAVLNGRVNEVIDLAVSNLRR